MPSLSPQTPRLSFAPSPNAAGDGARCWRSPGAAGSVGWGSGAPWAFGNTGAQRAPPRGQPREGSRGLELQEQRSRGWVGGFLATMGVCLSPRELPKTNHLRFCWGHGAFAQHPPSPPSQLPAQRGSVPDHWSVKEAPGLVRVSKRQQLPTQQGKYIWELRGDRER